MRCCNVCVLLFSLAGLSVLRQTGLCAVSDVIICLTYACQQEPLVKRVHVILLVYVCAVRTRLCILFTAPIQTALSWLMLVFWCGRERQCHWGRINNAQRVWDGGRPDSSTTVVTPVTVLTVQQHPLGWGHRECRIMCGYVGRSHSEWVD